MTTLETKPSNIRTHEQSLSPNLRPVWISFRGQLSLFSEWSCFKSAQVIISKLSFGSTWQLPQQRNPKESIDEQASGGSLIHRHTRRSPCLEARTKEERAVTGKQRMWHQEMLITDGRLYQEQMQGKTERWCGRIFRCATLQPGNKITLGDQWSQQWEGLLDGN